MVGAGSVVTCAIPNDELWYGNPARRRVRVDADGQVIERFR
jgi:acetyltransferase-like isoleucine patch superfamily enzyme